ncbi:MAG: hypothetical protein J5871_05710 [Bacteroidales bacterium]|nr:hypothetical protein [Bacteroidales bacterium]
MQKNYMSPTLRLVSLTGGLLMVSVRTASAAGGSADSGVYAGSTLALEEVSHGSSFSETW